MLVGDVWPGKFAEPHSSTAVGSTRPRHGAEDICSFVVAFAGHKLRLNWSLGLDGMSTQLRGCCSVQCSGDKAQAQPRLPLWFLCSGKVLQAVGRSTDFASTGD